MITDIRTTPVPISADWPKRGYYVNLCWSRTEQGKTIRTDTKVGPFPESDTKPLIEFLNLLDAIHDEERGPKHYKNIPGYARWFHRKPYDTPLGLVIQTPYDDLDRNREYELAWYVPYYHDGVSSIPYYVEASYEGGYPCNSQSHESWFLQSLPQYHFERSMFVNAFNDVFGPETCEEIQDMCIEGKRTANFILDYNDGEYYVIHLPSGTTINWYKHLGRTNTCSKPGFGLDDLREMLLSLKEELDSE